MKIIAVNLKEKRLKQGWTQAQLAERLGVYPQHIYKLEAGLRNVTASLIADCVDLFGDFQFARISKAGERKYVVVPAEAVKPDRPDRRPHLPLQALSESERMVRLGKELAEAQAEIEKLPRALLSPSARREHLRRVLKESIDVDMVIDALIECAAPDIVAEAAAEAEAELCAECAEAMQPMEVRTA